MAHNVVPTDWCNDEPVLVHPGTYWHTLVHRCVCPSGMLWRGGSVLRPSYRPWVRQHWHLLRICGLLRHEQQWLEPWPQYVVWGAVWWGSLFRFSLHMIPLWKYPVCRRYGGGMGVWEQYERRAFFKVVFLSWFSLSTILFLKRSSTWW